MGSGYVVLFFQAEDGIRDLVRSRGLGDVYKRQILVLDFGQKSETQITESQPAMDLICNICQGAILDLKKRCQSQ